MRAFGFVSALTAVVLSSSAIAFAQDAATAPASAPGPAPAPVLTSSGSGSHAAGVATAPATETVTPASPAPTLAAIASAAPGSSTFQFVPNAICSETVVSKINLIYTKNRSMFDECVADADYQIFPHSGSHPTTKQIRDMATSASCVAIFTAVVLADFPPCDIGGMPMKAVTETLLKIRVDIDEGREAASEQRFQELMYWRRDVNLAQAAGVPFDSDSALYAEYKRNLWKALAATTVRVSSDFTLEYQLANGTYSRGKLSFSSLKDGSGSDSSGGVVGSVRPAGSSDGVLAGSKAQQEVTVPVNVSSSAPASLFRERGLGSLAVRAAALAVTSLLAASIFV